MPIQAVSHYFLVYLFNHDMFRICLHFNVVNLSASTERKTTIEVLEFGISFFITFVPYWG